MSANDQLPDVEFAQTLEKLRAGLISDGIHPKAADYIVEEIRERVLPIIGKPYLALQIPEELIPAFLQMQEYWFAGQTALIQQIANLVGENYALRFGSGPPPSTPKPPRRFQVVDGGKDGAEGE